MACLNFIMRTKVAAPLGRHVKWLCHCPCWAADSLFIEANLTKAVEVKRKTSQCGSGALYKVRSELNMTEVTQIIKRAISSARFNEGKVHNRVSVPYHYGLSSEQRWREWTSLISPCQRNDILITCVSGNYFTSTISLHIIGWHDSTCH